MRALLIVISAGALAAGCSSNRGDVPPVTAATTIDPSSPLSAPGYMAMAASSDMFEIESSRLALQMSQNPQVRSFAEMMIADHTRTGNEMRSIAQSLGLPAPPQMMMPQHRAMLDQLRAATPADFNRAYKAAQIAAHQQALNLHGNYAAQGDTPALRAFASRVVPTIQMHYNHAQTLPETTTPVAPVRPGERG